MADFVSVENTIAQLRGFNPRKKNCGRYILCLGMAIVWLLAIMALAKACYPGLGKFDSI